MQRKDMNKGKAGAEESCSIKDMNMASRQQSLPSLDSPEQILAESEALYEEIYGYPPEKNKKKKLS